MSIGTDRREAACKALAPSIAATHAATEMLLTSLRIPYPSDSKRVNARRFGSTRKQANFRAAPLDRGHEVDFTPLTDGFEQPHRTHFAIHGYGNIRPQPAGIHQPVANPGPGALEVVDHLGYGRARDLHVRFTAG